MALVTTTEMFKKAYDGGYAIGAFNVNNMEIVQGITEACREEKAPVILQVSKGARAYANHTYLVKLVEAAVIESPEIPIALHLDHGHSFETCKSLHRRRLHLRHDRRLLQALRREHRADPARSSSTPTITVSWSRPSWALWPASRTK